MLQAHGDIDGRVPVEHATNLPHGRFKSETRIDFYYQMADFLDQDLSTGATTPALALPLPAR